MTTPAVTLRSSPVTAAEPSEARYAQACATSAASTSAFSSGVSRACQGCRQDNKRNADREF